MVLAELAGGVALRLEQLGDGRVFRLQADGGAGHADLREAGADRILAGDEAGAACGAALLRVVVGEEAAFVGDPVDVGGPVAHHAVAELADVPDADIVAPEDEDIGFFGGHICRSLSRLGLLAKSEEENIEAIGFDRANSILRSKGRVLSRKRKHALKTRGDALVHDIDCPRGDDRQRHQ